jgi:bifunctional UDP-N-acetylglucosamine pyrophosphorylase/glucosamine-1-phosphate N-acetyltransferase
MKFAIAILAAGKGTRLKSKRPKVLHAIGGQPLLEHVIHAASQIVEPSDIYVIIGHEADSVRAAVEHTGVRFVVQAEQRGTGHAIQELRSSLLEGDKPRYDQLLVLSGDVPLIRPETIAQVRDFHAAQNAAMTILTAVLPDATGYGRVIRRSSDSPEVAAIVEQKALTNEQRSLKEINSGIYAFSLAPLLAHISRLTTANAHAEYYLTDMAALLVAAAERVVAVPADDAAEVLGANTIREMMLLDRAMRLRTAETLMADGVTIFRPETTVIDASVEIAADAVIEPFVQLLGKTRIGADTVIRSYSVLRNVQVGEGVLIRNSCVAEDSIIANGAQIGPFAHLRPGSQIGENAHVGNFVETKKARLGKGAKANHLAYLGDADVGDNTNVGAGVITCNYDGIHKHPTTIGANVFVGSDSTLVAPLTIGDGAYIAAGSSITEDVPADALALGRSRQITKPDWAKKRRETRRN